MPRTNIFDRESWIVISHAFNMDGRAASQTVTDKIPVLIANGIKPIVVSAITGRKDEEIEHHQVFAAAPSGLKFDLRHYFREKYKDTLRGNLYKTSTALLLLPFYLIERLFIQRDSHWSWYYPAYKKAIQLAQIHNASVIYSSGGANSAHLAGYYAHKKTGLPWIVEVHDPMVHDDWEKSSKIYNRAAMIEKIICSHSTACWWFTPTALQRAKKRNPNLGSRGHWVIPGAQKPDFGKTTYQKTDQFRISHFGSLSKSRNLASFFQAVRIALHNLPEMESYLSIHIFGSKLDSLSMKSIKIENLHHLVHSEGRLEYDAAYAKSGRQQVLEKMRTTDLLLLIQGISSFSEEYVPSKFYEYAWCKRPILALYDRGNDMKNIINNAGYCCISENAVSVISDAIISYYCQWKNNTLFDRQEGSPYTIDKAVKQIIQLAENSRTNN
jgi:hypothetical protein